jgi:purine-binding chemotaxis protein CheW
MPLLATFYVRDSLCAMDASGVQEVIRLGSVSPVPHAPPEVAGIINLRGRIVTLLDVGLILGFAKSGLANSDFVEDERERDSRIFIVEDRNEFLGLLVDRVGEVIEIEPGSTESLPANITPAQARFFESVCRDGGRVIALLNIRELLTESGVS